MTSNQTVLIIDDSTPMREIAADMLRLLDMTVLTARNGAEGITLFKQYPIDLILLDVNMPVMNGADTYQALLSIDPDIKVVVCSSESKSKVQFRFGELAVPMYLHKPFDTGVLLDMVQAVMTTHSSILH
ncbi:MAG: response regulator [Chloroflexi bacterium]|nr:response regulator [Chloroflexota bacterium]